MRGNFLRSCGRRFHGLLERRSFLDSSSSSSYLSPHYEITGSIIQHARSYARSSLLHKKLKGLKVSPSVHTSGYLPYSSSKNGFLNWYLAMLDSRPIITKSLSSGAIFMAADISSQMITNTSSDSFDLIRTLRMGGYGIIVLGPTLHLWFNFLSIAMPKRDVISTLKKIVFGQTVFGPIMTAVFFSVNSGVQGDNGAEILARLKRDMLPTLTNGLLYWPVCDYITYKFIPVRLQPLICNSFSFVWTIYLTSMASLKKVDNISTD